VDENDFRPAVRVSTPFSVVGETAQSRGYGGAPRFAYVE
jgi:hypothetical protein